MQLGLASFPLETLGAWGKPETALINAVASWPWPSRAGAASPWSGCSGGARAGQEKGRDPEVA